MAQRNACGMGTLVTQVNNGDNVTKEYVHLCLNSKNTFQIIADPQAISLNTVSKTTLRVVAAGEKGKPTGNQLINDLNVAKQIAQKAQKIVHKLTKDERKQILLRNDDTNEESSSDEDNSNNSIIRIFR